MNISISFPQSEPRDRMIDPIEYLVDVDGVRVRARIELSTLQALNEGGPAGDSAIRDFVGRYRSHIERAIEAHILARGIPPGGLIVLGLEELRGVDFPNTGRPR